MLDKIQAVHFVKTNTLQDVERDIIKVQRRVTGVQMKACHCDGFLERSCDKKYIYLAVNFNNFIVCVFASMCVCMKSLYKFFPFSCSIPLYSTISTGSSSANNKV